MDSYIIQASAYSDQTTCTAI